MESLGDAREKMGVHPISGLTRTSAVRVVRGRPEENGKFVVEMLQRAASDGVEPFLDSVQDRDGPRMSLVFREDVGKLRKAYPHFKVRFITDIQPDNVDEVRRLMMVDARAIDVRHIDGIKLRFAVTRKEYLTASEGLASGLPKELVCSDSEDLVSQMRSVFQLLWESAVPAQVRVREIDEGMAEKRTVVLRGADKATETAYQVVERARRTIDILAQPAFAQWIYEHPLYSGLLREGRSRGVRMRYVTELTKENVAHCRWMMDELSVEIRHLDGVKGSFFVSEDEFLSAFAMEGLQDAGAEAVHSMIPGVVERNRSIFDLLWSRAIPADIKVREFELGEEPGDTRVSFDAVEILAASERFLEEMEEEALIIVPSERSFAENPLFFQKIASTAARTGARVRVLGGFDRPEAELVREFKLDGVRIRSLDTSHPLSLGLGIYDRKAMSLAQYIYPDFQGKKDAGQSYLSAVISTNGQAVSGIANIFESLWGESELRERESNLRMREERANREARLLHDILVHDLGNYIQVTMLSAELMRDEIAGNEQANQLLDKLVRSIYDSSALLERARQLGRAITEAEPKLQPISLIPVVEQSLSLVRKNNPGKEIVGGCVVLAPPPRRSSSSSGEGEIFVRADRLLSEVFVNLYKNSVAYTDGGTVRVETTIAVGEEGEEGRQQGQEEDAGRGAYRGHIKVSVLDHGRGIPDHMKAKVFGRYLEGASGSGLGMSIVHALVVDRYGGRVALRDRVPGDPSKGTVVELWLPRGSQ